MFEVTVAIDTGGVRYVFAWFQCNMRAWLLGVSVLLIVVAMAAAGTREEPVSNPTHSIDSAEAKSFFGNLRK